MSEKVTILIPIHNGIKYTLECLNSVDMSDYINKEVVIIDDDSSDNSSAIIKKKYPEAVIIKGDGNLWWSGGMNKGLEYAFKKGTDYVLLLNNDNILKEDMISELLLAAKENKKAIISSKVFILGEENKIFYAGGFSSSRRGGLYTRACGEEDNGMYNVVTTVEWCTGMGVLIPSNIAKDVGYFNNRDFPQYYGDADYYFRARKKGYSIIFNPKSICWNNRDQTGIGLNKEKITFNFIKKLLTSNKSNNNLRVNIKFYYRYFNKILASQMLCVRYGILFLGLAKRFIMQQSWMR